MKSLSSIFAKCMQASACNNPGIGSAILRIGVGIIFVLAGISKLISLKMTVFMFAQIGLAPWWVYVVSAIETAGGLLLLLGLWTRYVSIPLGIAMLVATVIQFRYGGGLMGAISPLVLLLVQVQFYLAGSSTWSLENRLGLCSCGICGKCTSGAGVNSEAPECVCSNSSAENCTCDSSCTDCVCASKKE